MLCYGLHSFSIDLHHFCYAAVFAPNFSSLVSISALKVTTGSKSAMIIHHLDSNLISLTNPISDTSCHVLMTRHGFEL
jgi:hypothetical protein